MAAAGVTLLELRETGVPKQRAWGLIQEEGQPGQPGPGPPLPPRVCPKSPMIRSLGPQGRYLQDSTRPLTLDCVTAFHPRPSRKAPVSWASTAPDRP